MPLIGGMASASLNRTAGDLEEAADGHVLPDHQAAATTASPA
jgi:hypothetical protein